MIRRRRPVREIAFSFDSFLDVVANVVGIIIRLILVVWVGARSYGSLTVAQRASAPSPPPAQQKGEPEDPFHQELARHRRELAAAQERLLVQLRRMRQAQILENEVHDELKTLAARKQEQDRHRSQIQEEKVRHQAAAQTVALSLEDLRLKGRCLRESLRELEKQAPAKHTLHYRTPVSQPVDAEEVLFECRHGRVTYIDIPALLEEARRGLDDKSKQLQTQWEVRDVTGPVGAFRLHYTVARSRGVLDTLPNSGPPVENSYRYGLTEWQLEAVAPERGETDAAALAEGSQFRQIVAGLDPRQSVVTLWVYPDSFEEYRRIRDYLYDHDIVVAGRPLPEGIPITCSRQGSRSRGQ